MKVKALRVKVFTAAAIADLETAVNDWVVLQDEQELVGVPQYQPTAAAFTCVLWYLKS